MVRNARDDHIVSALKKQLSKLGKLCGTIRQPVHEYEDPFCWMSVLRELDNAFLANTCGRASDQSLDLPYRLSIWKRLSMRVIHEWSMAHRQVRTGGQEEDRQQGACTQRGTDEEETPHWPALALCEHQDRNPFSN